MEERSVLIYFLVNTSYKIFMESTSNTQSLTKTFIANLRPAYYDRFQCIAQQCQVDCCTGWTIAFNRKDYLNIRQQKGSEQLNNAIKQALHRQKSPSNTFYAMFQLTEDGCPLLTEQRLCRLQLECGYHVLPHVCKVFPRLKDYPLSGYYEQSLSPACEAVLELLWQSPEGIDFVSDPLPKTEYVTKTFSVQDIALASYFQEIRALCIGILQDRRFPVQKRILLIGFFLQKLSAENTDIPAWLAETEAMLQHPAIEALADQFFASITEDTRHLILLQHIRSLASMNAAQKDKKLSAHMQAILQHWITKTTPKEQEQILHITANTEKFHKALYNFSAQFAEKEYFFENLAVCVFFQQALPNCSSFEALWKSYVNFCNLYSLFRFTAIADCLIPSKDEITAKNRLFLGILYISRNLLHSSERQTIFTDQFFDSQNTSLAHMVLLLCL